MITKQYKKIADIYKIFAQDENKESLDFSPEALQKMFDYESNGDGNVNVESQHLEYLKTGKKVNGYSVGKKFMDITISSWIDTVKNPGWLAFMEELYCDEFPWWWLDKIFKDFVNEKNNQYKSLGISNENSPENYIDKMKQKIKETNQCQ
uniref:Uncharacterized protein n=1 Tax=viral metagenome TaxID=1070528 RepID=A0A6M3KGL3_9ZZZZ